MYPTTEIEAVAYSIAEKINEILDQFNLLKLENDNSNKGGEKELTAASEMNGASGG